MRYLVINLGSSSIKLKAFSNLNEELKFSTSFDPLNPNFEDLHSEIDKQVSGLKNYDLVIHRVVHGGETYTKPTLLSQNTLEELQKFNDLAPLHNPNQIAFAKFLIQKVNVKNYAVFDTSFNLTMPKENFLYGLPYGYYENLKVRRYGFHGSAHKYVYSEVSNILNEKDFNLISCHLGSGCSVCAIKNGTVIDNSFGFSPNENLIMATRVGEIDFDALIYIKKKLMLNDADLVEILSTESGLLGISGYTKDVKQLADDYFKNERAKLAIDMFVNLIAKHIAGFLVDLGDLDVLSFSGGIGSGSFLIRDLIIKKLKVFGINLNSALNDGKIDVEYNLELTGTNSKSRVFIIPTNEELQMLKDVLEII